MPEEGLTGKYSYEWQRTSFRATIFSWAARSASRNSEQLKLIIGVLMLIILASMFHELRCHVGKGSMHVQNQCFFQQ